MAKLQLNEDGSMTFPLRGREPITLDEPTMADLGWLTEEADAIDSSLPSVPTVTDREDQEQVNAWIKATDARTTAIYTGEMPYGKLLIEIVRRITASDGTEVVVDPSQLYGWAASPAVIRKMLEVWRAPLPGPASLLTE